MFRLTTVAALLALVRFTAAAPGGAPVCTADESAPGLPHRDPGFTEETIAEGALSITIDGEPLVEGTPLDLLVGATYEVTIATDSFFRGVMARMAGGDAEVDTLGLFEVATDDINLQVSTPCTAAGVSIAVSCACMAKLIRYTILLRYPSLSSHTFSPYLIFLPTGRRSHAPQP